ncbi:MAG TPA: glutathionylspermidine synthase family protein [Cyclobacteriaceae bacterium]|nr:glutathionylspermidine synthase family protein [Cyclobacteriaceae bacterium]
MKRFKIPVRENWKEKVEKIGFHYHTLDGALYWDESVYYAFDRAQIIKLEQTTNELYRLCLKAVDHIVRYNLLELFSIPDEFVPFIIDSWEKRERSVYGRFDISWNGDLTTPPKMLEFNADTPTSLFEASVVQWFWAQELFPHHDQFNSIHEKLIAHWRNISSDMHGHELYFSCLEEFPEDFINVNYLRDCAAQAGVATRFINVHDIGRNRNSFTDLDENIIHTIFKLYPWEWMMNEEYGSHLLTSTTQWIEPAWKMILSNKAILPVLWRLFPGHPNLLECYFDDPHTMKSYAKKPLLSREGANVTLVEDGTILTETEGEYGDEGFIYQQLHKLPDFDGCHPVIGSWIIGEEAAGIGIRETTSLVTDNFSRFLPHIISCFQR